MNNSQRTSNPHCNGEPAREGSLVVCQSLQNRPHNIFCCNNETVYYPEIKNKLLVIAQNITILSSTTVQTVIIIHATVVITQQTQNIFTTFQCGILVATR